jgi:mono/diheme cytochrome c family protein
MVFKKSILLGLIGVSLGVLSIGQGTALSQTTRKVLKVVAPQYSDPSSGKQMFKDYCAVCHGTDGKGGGPAAELLKTAPPDLTTLAERHGRKIVAHHVRTILRDGVQNKEDDGALSMPHWGKAFRSSNLNPRLAELRMHNLSDYVESLQKQ